MSAPQESRRFENSPESKKPPSHLESRYGLKVVLLSEPFGVAFYLVTGPWCAGEQINFGGSLATQNDFSRPQGWVSIRAWGL